MVILNTAQFLQIEYCGSKNTKLYAEEKAMPSNACPHERRMTAIFSGDISRPENENTVYSTSFRVNICSRCGQAEFYCQSHENVCMWLAGDEKPPSKA